MTKFQLTIAFDDIDTLQATTQAVADVIGKKKKATTTDAPTDDGAPAEEETARKARTAKPTNGKTEGNGKPAGVREKALQICRDLLESGGDSAKKDLKGLRDEFEVKKLSDVPLEAAEQFLAKAQKLREKYNV